MSFIKVIVLPNPIMATMEEYGICIVFCVYITFFYCFHPAVLTFSRSELQNVICKSKEAGAEQSIYSLQGWIICSLVMWEESVLLTLLGGRMGSDEWCTSRYLDNIFLEISISTFQVVILFEINDENILYVSRSLLDKHKSKIKKERVLFFKLENIWFAISLDN